MQDKPDEPPPEDECRRRLNRGAIGTADAQTERLVSLLKNMIERATCAPPASRSHPQGREARRLACAGRLRSSARATEFRCRGSLQRGHHAWSVKRSPARCS